MFYYDIKKGAHELKHYSASLLNNPSDHIRSFPSVAYQNTSKRVYEYGL